MADRGWKALERRLAADVGTRRIPCAGERDGADFQTAQVSYQVKCRRMLPAWMWEWLTGIQRTALRNGRACGVLVLKTPRMQDDEALVVLRWADWRKFQPGPSGFDPTNDGHVGL